MTKRVPRVVVILTNGGEDAATTAAGTAALPSPADEVDDFKPITVFQHGFGPEGSRYDVMIQFHCDAVGLHAESLNQRGQCRRRNAELSLFPIDLKFHFAEARVTAEGASRWENS